MIPDGAPHVLVVDDEPSIVRALVRVLGREFHVTAVAGGQEALDLFAGGAHYDVVMCDLMMPRVDGMAVYHAVMAREAKPRGWILMTGGLVPPATEAFLAAHEVQTLTKPFGLNTMLELVRELAYGADGPEGGRPPASLVPAPPTTSGE